MGSTIERCIKYELFENTPFWIDENGKVICHDRILLTNYDGVKNWMLAYLHNSRCTIHPSDTKTNKDFKHMFWPPSIKNEIAKCITMSSMDKSRAPKAQQIAHSLGDTRIKLEVTINIKMSFPWTESTWCYFDFYW